MACELTTDRRRSQPHMKIAKTSEPSPPLGMTNSCATPGEPYYHEILRYFTAHTRWLSHYAAAPEEAYAELHRVYQQLQPSVRSFLYGYIGRYHGQGQGPDMIRQGQQKVIDHQSAKIAELQDLHSKIAIENMRLRRELDPPVVYDTLFNPHCDLPHRHRSSLSELVEEARKAREKTT